VTFQGHDYGTTLYLQWPTIRKSCMIYRTAPFSDLERPLPPFKVTPFFDAECLRNVRHADIVSLKY